MKPALLPPGAYGRYLQISIPSMTSCGGSPSPFGQTTVTWYPASRSAWLSSQTRRSNGTGRFWTMIRTRAHQPIPS